MRSCIHNARRQVAVLRAALLAPSPEGINACLRLLEQASLELSQCVEDHSPQPVAQTSVCAELQALALDLRAAAALIDHDIAFQQAWIRLLAGATAGYRPDGEPESLRASGSVSIQA